MLDTEFLEQVQEVIAACSHPELQKAVFSATLPANAEKVAMSMLRNPIRVVVGLKYVCPGNDEVILLMTYTGTHLSPLSHSPSPTSLMTSRSCRLFCSIYHNRTTHPCSSSFLPNLEQHHYRRSLSLAAYPTWTAYTPA